MSTILTVPRTSHLPEDWSLADVQKHLGGVPLERIRLFPPPGFATVEDVDFLNAKKDRLCELIDGVLLEKTMGGYESLLAMRIGIALGAFLEKNPIGVILAQMERCGFSPIKCEFRTSVSSVFRECRTGSFPENPFLILFPIWPSKCFPQAIHAAKWNKNAGSISKLAYSWSGTSIRPHARRLFMRPRTIQELTMRRQTRFPAAMCCPVFLFRSPTFSPEPNLRRAMTTVLQRMIDA